MAIASTTERLGRFCQRAHAAGCDVELHHQSRGLVARIDKGETADGAVLEQMARDHAACLHGRQGYELRAVYDEGSVKQSLPFRMAGESTEDEAMPEVASEKGMLATLQRQNERLLTSLERSYKPVNDALETLGKMLGQYQQQQADMFRQQLEIAAMQAERDAERRRDLLSEKKFDLLAQRFTPFLDGLAAKLGLLPPSAKDDVLLRFAESLDDAQQQAIVAVLTPAQLVMMKAKRYAELMVSVLEGGQIETLMPLLRPEQLMMLDTASGLQKSAHANGAVAAEKGA
jgi:hypothetical protein